MTKPTKWRCKQCGKSGTADIDDDCDVMEGIYQIKDEHSRVSPDCPFDAWNIQLLFDEVPTCRS
jgi:hypothetical protein